MPAALLKNCINMPSGHLTRCAFTAEVALSCWCRKENQIYSQEERAALAMFNYEENKKKEQKILGDMQKLVQSHLAENEDEDGTFEAPAGPQLPPTQEQAQ